MPMRPGIHISDPADFQDDGDDEYANKSAAEREAELRENISAHKARRDANARRPKTIGDLDPVKIFAKFNAPKSKTLGADADED